MSGSALNLGSSYAFRSVLETLPAACWIHHHGVVQYANPAIARLLGAPDADALAGVHVVDLLSPDAVEGFRVRIDRLLAGHEVPRCEQTLRLVEGGAVSVDVSSTVIDYEGERAILSVFHDITGQRRAEAALRNTEIRYRRLVEGSAVGVIEFTAEGILEANDVFLTLVGRYRRELPDGRIFWREVSPPDDDRLVQEKITELLSAGECKPFEKEFLGRDGERVPVLMSASLIDPAPAWRAVALVIDLRDRRKLEEIQQEKLRLESLGFLAAGMAHNLNNILTGVIGNASLLVEHQLVAPASRGAVVAGDIVRAGQRAAALTAQLLAYAGRGRFVISEVNLRELIASQVERMRVLMPDNIRLGMELPGELPKLLTDAEQLRHVLTALIDNAVEAIDGREGGAIIVAARVEYLADGGVLSRLGEPLPPGDYCVIDVRDNGAGMDSNTLAHAFDPFFSTKFPGRGLGLAAVSGIVRATRGAIRVSSSPGLGSVFQVFLPAADA
jgi:two-component system, chemotaxis family, CheB/CheR fusion protein